VEEEAKRNIINLEQKIALYVKILNEEVESHQ